MVSKIDKELGLNATITRRDFVYGSSLVLGGAVVGCSEENNYQPNAYSDYSFDVNSDWYGPGGIGLSLIHI